MGFCHQIALPTVEPVTLLQARTFLRLPTATTQQDGIITGLIQAAREQGEILTCRSLAKRKFVQVLDSFPYYTDTVGSQLSYPPSFYGLPRYSTTQWNYSQAIKLGYSPCISVESMQYIDTAGVVRYLQTDVDFTLDREREPSRLFPTAGQYWPSNFYVANSVKINYTAGYDPNPAAVDTHVIVASPPFQQPSSTIVTGIPQMLIFGILNLVYYWFTNLGCGGCAMGVPDNIAQIFLNNAVIDFAPTPG